LRPGPRFVKKEFTGLRSHKDCETLDYAFMTCTGQPYHWFALYRRLKA